MKKKVFIDDRADKELKEFTSEVQNDFKTIIAILEDTGRLDFPDARKITNDIFEMRVMHGGIYRSFYAYIRQDCVIILHFFQKKQQKLPLKHIKLAQKRLNEYV